MTLYDTVRDLPLDRRQLRLDGLEQQVSSGFLRKTTVIRLPARARRASARTSPTRRRSTTSPRREGPMHRWRASGRSPRSPQHLDQLALFDHEPDQHAYRDYRRWAYESAALDLALRQPGLSLGAAVGRTARPLTFVVSMRLGEPATTARLQPGSTTTRPAVQARRNARLDGGADRRARADRRGRLGRLQGPVPRHQRRHAPRSGPSIARIVVGLPDAWLEDPALTPETEAVLEPHHERVTWDAMIHSVADIEALRWPPRTVNVKPSRFGSVERLFAAYDYCAAHGIGAYGGGQFELGVGRDQIQLLAALFHPDTPNDVAPGVSTWSRCRVSPRARSRSSPRATGFGTVALAPGL